MKNGDSGALEGLGMLLPVLMGIVILVNGILVFVRKEEEINFALLVWIASKVPSSDTSSSSGNRGTKQKRASYSGGSSYGSGGSSSSSGSGVDPNAREKKKLREAIRINKDEIERCEKRLEDYYKKGSNAASTFDVDPKAMQRKIDDLKRDVAIDEKKLEKLG